MQPKLVVRERSPTLLKRLDPALMTLKKDDTTRFGREAADVATRYSSRVAFGGGGKLFKYVGAMDASKYVACNQDLI
jgi:hypothetical protein